MATKQQTTKKTEQKEFTTSELDAIARRGMGDVEKFFTSSERESTDVRAKKVQAVLKFIGEGTRRKSAKNNGIAIMMRLAKAVEATPSEIRPLWRKLSQEI